MASNDSKDSPYATSNVKELLQTIRDKPQLTPRKPYVLGGARLPHLSRLKHLTKVPMIVAVEKPKDVSPSHLFLFFNFSFRQLPRSDSSS